MNGNTHRKPKLEKEEIIYRGRRVTLTKRFYTFNNEEFIREIVVFGQSVAILPFKDMDQVILIEQFRPSQNKWILEVPAGVIEENEKPEETAERELIEEIGYKPNKLVKMASIYMSPGYSDEILHIYIALDLTRIGEKPEKGELIRIVTMNFNEALKKILEEDIVDAKTLLAFLLAKIYVIGGYS